MSNACPTCKRRFPGRPRKLEGVVEAIADAATGELIGPAAAGALLGITAAAVRRLDPDLLPTRGTNNHRLYDRGKLEALAAKLPAAAPDVSLEWLPMRAVVQLTGLQEQTLRDADARLQPRRQPRADGTLGPRLYHRSVVLAELVRLGRVAGASAT
jgi:hypothetical protein